MSGCASSGTPDSRTQSPGSTASGTPGSPADVGQVVPPNPELQRDPHTVVLTFLDAIINDQPDVSYSYLSPTAQEHDTLEDWEAKVHGDSPYYKLPGTSPAPPQLIHETDTSVNSDPYPGDAGVPLKGLSFVIAGPSNNYRFDVTVADHADEWSIVNYLPSIYPHVLPSS